MWSSTRMALTSFTLSSQTTAGETGGRRIRRASRAEQMQFVAVHFDNLSSEMAKGQGQYLASLSALMGCRPEQRASLSSLTQGKFESLLHPGDSSPERLLVNLNREMRADPILHQCTRLYF